MLMSEIFVYFSIPNDCFIRVYCVCKYKSTDDHSIMVTVNFSKNYYWFMDNRPNYVLKII